MKSLYIFLVILISLGSSINIVGQVKETNLFCGDSVKDYLSVIGELEKTVLAEMRAKRVPGTEIAIVCKGKMVYKKGLGVRSLETQTSVNSSDLFRLGSTTKMFVALAAVNLAEKGKIDLNAPIGNYASKLHPKLASLTLNQLLSHTSGLRDDAPQRGSFDESALEKRVLSWDEKVLFAKPDEVFSYSNPGYVLVSYVLEKVQGKLFGDIMSEQVFRPLGMKRSTFRPLMAMTYPFVQGHMPSSKGMEVARPFAENAANWAPGSMFSNVEEISQYLIAFLNVENNATKQNSVASALKIVKAPKTDVIAMNRKYGYGWVSFRERGMEIMMHTGGRLGFGSIIWTVPKQQFGVVILANSPAIFSNSACKAMTLLLPTKKDLQHPVKNQVGMSSKELSVIAGVYANNDRIRVELISKNEQLTIKFANREFKVDKVGENQFRALGAGPLTNFTLTRSADGKIRYLHAEYWALKLEK